MVVLIEGPPEADALIPLAADEDMRPPVALLAHAVDEPGRSAFWPLAEFSPEWVAIRWALEHGVPARFIDLPATHTLAWEKEDEGEGEGEEGEARAGRRKPTRMSPRRPRCGLIRSPCSRGPAVTTIRSAGGRTSSSTGGRGGRRVRSLRGARRGHGRAAGGVRHRGPRPGSGAGGVHAPPSTGGTAGVRGCRSGRGVRRVACARTAAEGRCRRRPGAAEGAAQGQGGRDLGAVDASAGSRGRAGTARASTRPAGTGICSVRGTGRSSGG